MRVWNKERLLIKKVPTERMEDLEVPRIRVKKVQSSGFYFEGRGKWEGLEVIDYLGLPPGSEEIVLSLLILVDVHLVMRFLLIFDKQYTLPFSPRKRHFLVRGCFCKNRLMISMSSCKKLLTRWLWEQSWLEHDGVREVRHFTVLQEVFLFVFKYIQDSYKC